jgi:hypothetical protein
VASGSASIPVNLVVGNNTITILVTDVVTGIQQTYTVTVMRATPPVQLSNLTISSGTLNPSFDSGILSYTVNVTYDVLKVNVTPTAQGACTINVNGVSVISGTASGDIPLNSGDNTINIVVTTQDGSTSQTYSIKVTRPFGPYLTNLVLSRGDNGNIIPLNPSFDMSVITYTATAGTTSVNVTPTADAGTSATITVKGQTVPSGSTTATAISVPGFGNIAIPVVVTLASGITKTYTITVKK